MWFLALLLCQVGRLSLILSNYIEIVSIAYKVNLYTIVIPFNWVDMTVPIKKKKKITKLKKSKAVGTATHD
jgi:hypothetical protein